MDRRNFPDKIVYHYNQEANTPLQIAHGVWGGINPHGEIEICFYHESDMPPQVAEQQIGADGMPGPERGASMDSSRHIERRIHTRILINYDTARALHNWLDERLNELDSESSPEIYDPNPGIQQ